MKSIERRKSRLTVHAITMGAALVMVAMSMLSCSSVTPITLDYAKDYEFGAVKTFRYLDTPRSNVASTVIDQGIQSAIRKQLVADGLVEVSGASDVMVTYHVTRDGGIGIETPLPDAGGYGGWGPGWVRWGYAGPSSSWKRWEYEGPTLPTTRDYQTVYPDGTLVLDAFDPQTKRLLWRGTGTLPDEGDPQERLRQTEQIIIAISNRWRRILEGMGS